MLILRQEEESDFRTVENMTREAFWNRYKPGCDEHLVLHRFRTDAAFVPELDLVLEDGDGVAAHIMYARAHVRGDNGALLPVMMFGPVSVCPAKQRRGYGSLLIRCSLQKAAALGCGGVVIEGDPDFYHRFGFASSSQYGVFHPGVPREEESPFSMALELKPGYFKGTCGELVIPDGYFVTPEETECFDRDFPPKVKLRLPGQLV